MSFLLAQIFVTPARIGDLDNRQYGQLIRQARSANLLASLSLRLEDQGLLEQVPPAVRRHLDSAVVVHAKQKRDLAYELKMVQRALSPGGQQLVLLKGAAYIQADITAGRGRLVSDIDLIVPQHLVTAVETALNQHGWESGALDPYNERYYRQWMHEIPPLAHRKRGSTLDLHHTILPPTAAANINAGLLFENLVEAQPGVYTLCPEDMVIHSATHLFHEGEFHNGLRDLWDLDRMLQEFSARDPHFWQRLVDRARALDLVGSLFHGLSYSQQIFATPVPPAVIEQTRNWPRRIRKPFMDLLFLRAFRPPQPESKLPFTGIAAYLLFVRSHYLRMPLYLLIPHLARKAWMARFGNSAGAEAADAVVIQAK